MGLKDNAERAGEVLWEEQRGELADWIVAQAIIMFGEDKVRKNFQNKIFWNVLRPAISFLLPKKWKPADLLVDLSAEMQDAFKRRLENNQGNQGGKDEKKAGNDSDKTKAAPADLITIKQALGASDCRSDFFYNLYKSSFKNNPTLCDKILNYAGTAKEVHGWIRIIAEVGQDANNSPDVQEEKLKFCIDLLLGTPVPKEPEVEKILIWAEISGGKYPRLELRIEALRAATITTGKNKDRAIFRYLESLRPDKLQAALETLEKMDEDDFQMEADLIYGRDPSRYGDKIIKTINEIDDLIYEGKDPVTALAEAQSGAASAKARFLAKKAARLARHS